MELDMFWPSSSTNGSPLLGLTSRSVSVAIPWPDTTGSILFFINLKTAVENFTKIVPPWCPFCGVRRQDAAFYRARHIAPNQSGDMSPHSKKRFPSRWRRTQSKTKFWSLLGSLATWRFILELSWLLTLSVKQTIYTTTCPYWISRILAHPTAVFRLILLIGARGFEPPTTWTPFLT